MGHRRSHHRVDDKGDGQKVGHWLPEPKPSKPKRSFNDESRESDDDVHQRSKVIKRGNKRKRDDVTSKGYAQGPKSKDPHGSSKMSSKQKTKKFSRWKSFSGPDSQLSGGKSSASSMGFSSVSDSSCHSHSDDSSYSSGSREQSRKRSRAHHFEEGQIIETVNKDLRKRVSRSSRRDEEMCDSRSELFRGDHETHRRGNTAELIQGNDCLERVTSFVVERQHNKFIDGQAREVCISTGLEQEKGQLNTNLAGEEAGSDNGAIRASLLEIELRQKALTNLMRHRDSTGGRSTQKETSNSSAPTIQDAENEENIVEEVTATTEQHSTVNCGEEMDKGCVMETGDLLGMLNVISVHDGNIDDNRWPLAIDISPHKKYSIEPRQDAVEYSTPRKPVAVGDLKKQRKSTFNEEKLTVVNAVVSAEVTDTSHKYSLLPSENETQLETKCEVRTTNETSRNRDLCKDMGVSMEENNSVMANCSSEVAKVDASQAEAKGNFTISESISTNAVHLSESVDLPFEKLHSNSELENKGSTDKVEPLVAKGSPIDTGLSKEENIEDTNSGYIAGTAVKLKSPNKKRSPHSSKDCGRDSVQSVPKPEVDPQKQEDGASMFQQKTMSVMRGGELVQVNYKVYIPKRAAELARRRLQR